MGDNLSFMQKGENVNLTKKDPSMRRVMVCLGWDAPEMDHGHPFDLDACAFLLGADGRVKNDGDFIYYNHLRSKDGYVKHHGDNETGISDESDDEKIEINLESLPLRIDKIAFSVTIHQADERQQNFGIVKNAYIRVLNLETGVELAHFDLTEKAAGKNGFIFGELYRSGEDWRFLALEVGTTGGIYKIVKDYDVNVSPASLRDRVVIRGLQE